MHYYYNMIYDLSLYKGLDKKISKRVKDNNMYSIKTIKFWHESDDIVIELEIKFVQWSWW